VSGSITFAKKMAEKLLIGDKTINWNKLMGGVGDQTARSGSKVASTAKKSRNRSVEGGKMERAESLHTEKQIGPLKK